MILSYAHPALAAQARAQCIAFNPRDSVGSPATLLAPFFMLISEDVCHPEAW